MTYQTVRSVEQYRLMFDHLPPYSAAEFILRELRGYRLFGRNNYLPADRQRLENALVAWLISSHEERL
jgi:hypothetical protein